MNEKRRKEIEARMARDDEAPWLAATGWDEVLRELLSVSTIIEQQDRQPISLEFNLMEDLLYFLLDCQCQNREWAMKLYARVRVLEKRGEGKS